jgi:hypothetical protein
MALLAAWLGAEAAAAADVPPTNSEVAQGYTHDNNRTVTTLEHAVTERSPPATCECRTTNDAFDLCSCGDPLCPRAVPNHGHTTYDHAPLSAAVDNPSRGASLRPVGPVVGPTTTHTFPSGSAQGAAATGTTQEQVHCDCEGSPSLAPVGVATNGADNVVNGTRLGQQLARESTDSVFTSSGRLSSGAIADSRQIIPGSRLGNKDLISRLTSHGSDIADWGKYATRTHQSPSGDFQVHFYMNRVTGAVDYGYDYKVIFNGAR